MFIIGDLLKKGDPKKILQSLKHYEGFSKEQSESLNRGITYKYNLAISKIRKWVIVALATLLSIFVAVVLSAVVCLSYVYVKGILVDNPNKELGYLLSTVIMTIVSSLASFLAGSLNKRAP